MSERVLGVDFSGARRPGEAVWVAEASLRDGDLVVERCRSAREALGATGRADVFRALVEFVVAADGSTVAGFDFPFGLPRAVVGTLGGPGTWRETVSWVGETFADADGFAERCKEAAREVTEGDRTYLRRTTDDPVGAKSPYHFFVFRQAYHGITGVLEPLLERGVRAAPMSVGADDATTALEAYPAGTLRRLGLPDERYKNDTDEARTTREAVLAGLEREAGVTSVAAAREAALADAGGDALDALVAAVAAARASDRDFAVDSGRYDPLEGYVYV